MATRRKMSIRTKIKKDASAGKNKGRGTVKAVKKQTGSSSKEHDKLKKALKPGWRISKTGRVYYEARKNRSDRRGRI
jgi:hypothetical protein